MTKLEASTEKSCLEEISHMVLDAGKKVTLPMLSHNHSLPFVQCSELLEQWLKSNKVHVGKVACSYYVQYQDENSNPAVAMVSFDKLKSLKIDKKNKDIKETLFAIALSTANRSTGLQESFDNIHIPIKTKFGLRNIVQRPVPTPVEPKIHVKAEKVTTAGTKNISKIFGSSSSKEVKKEEVKKSPVKKESPPTKKESPKKPVKVAAASSSKGNISSFFSKGAVKPSIKPEPPKTPKEEPTTSKKISSIIDSDDDEVIEGTPQEKRTRKPAKKPSAAKKIVQSTKHSRIAVIEDSSESEAEEEEKDLKRQEREIEIDATEEVEERSPEKPQKVVETKSAGPLNRRKGYREVLRKYQDEDGFLVTRKEKEEYFISDEEGPAEKKQKSEEPAPVKQEPKPTPKTKQKNIMSFFNRK